MEERVEEHCPRLRANDQHINKHSGAPALFEKGIKPAQDMMTLSMRSRPPTQECITL